MYSGNLKAFIAGLLRVTAEDSLSEIPQYDPHSGFDCFHCFQRLTFSIFILHHAVGRSSSAYKDSARPHQRKPKRETISE